MQPCLPKVCFGGEDAARYAPEPGKVVQVVFGVVSGRRRGDGEPLAQPVGLRRFGYDLVPAGAACLVQPRVPIVGSAQP